MKLGVLFSSGKDSVYAMYLMSKKHEITCLITVKSKNPDSYMFHTPNIDITSLQADALGLPLITGETEGEKEKELEDLFFIIQKAREDFKLDGIVTGALRSQYQKERIGKICRDLKLECFSPLWGMDQEKEVRDILELGYEIILSSIAAEGLDKSWLGRKLILDDLDKLIELKDRLGLNIAGEGGEMESLVLSGPIFKRRIKIEDAEIEMESENTGRYVIKKAILE